MVFRFSQQLGYVVHSSYELSFGSALVDSHTFHDEASTLLLRSFREITPIDSIVMSILSKNTNPMDVALRMDGFLTDFRCTLENMPESEIKDFATSVSKQLIKPIQNLGDEVSLQVSYSSIFSTSFTIFLISSC